ncbi:uncharacterized protein LAESUDRAFT_135010 [Laetiporus sulphureus 93-53]|uniref:Uncharacterized protein n=1 Tax=Laetiporus sulphureus 93-53 TaxID=1314785 RepID=A0A165EIM6_9APHY|nr:uncharacterized protein LAESUDRAFT_135010 [Laetiporus sulphureus 93-53]KZT07130.1 hypothetical protein LAESUDRAFT_135010 [Laetiporus sulphureus 93-53]
MANLTFYEPTGQTHQNNANLRECYFSSGYRAQPICGHYLYNHRRCSRTASLIVCFHQEACHGEEAQISTLNTIARECMARNPEPSGPSIWMNQECTCFAVVLAAGHLALCLLWRLAPHTSWSIIMLASFSEKIQSSADDTAIVRQSFIHARPSRSSFAYCIPLPLGDLAPQCSMQTSSWELVRDVYATGMPWMWRTDHTCSRQHGCRRVRKSCKGSRDQNRPVGARLCPRSVVKVGCILLCAQCMSSPDRL